MTEEKEATLETPQETKNTAPPENPMVVLQKQFDEMKEKYLRALADGENSRKRFAKEKQEIIGFTIENAIGEFLPAIDHFENALKLAEGATGDVKNWAIGFQMIFAQLKEVLQNYGISAFQSCGQLFDPQLHDAVEIQETDEAPEGTILQEFSKGYKSSTRTIRPARVKVARAKKTQEAPAPTPVETPKDKN